MSISKNTIYTMNNEFDLHKKVVNFVRTKYPDIIFTCPLGDFQDTPVKRSRAWNMGYTVGSPDFFIMERTPEFSGLAIEFKTPKGNGKISEAQLKFLKRIEGEGWKCIISNNYDDIILAIVDYFSYDHRIPKRLTCSKCEKSFAKERTFLTHSRKFHK